MKSHTLVIIGILVFCVGGFFAGRLSSTSPTADTSVPSSTPPPRPNRDTSLSSEATTKLTRKINRPEPTTKKKDVNLGAMMRGVDAEERCKQLLAFIDDLAPDDFEAALNEFRSTGLTSLRNSEYSMLVSAWAKIDPIGALEYAKTESTTSYDETLTILETWTTRDPEAAIRWANENHDGKGSNPKLIGIIRALANTDLDRATELMLSMPNGSDRGAAFDGVQSALLSKGMIATQEWLDNLPDPVMRNDAMTRLVTSLAYADPQKAVELMDQQSSAVSKGITLRFVARAFQHNPQIAVDQIARLQDESSRKSAYSSYVQNWIRNDKTAALQWLARNAGKDPSLQNLYLKNQ